MRPIQPFLDPVTRKRWRRFRERKRAWWSLWLLFTLYGLSLIAELLCNDRPLYARFEGRSLFPAFKYYPEDRFLHNGSQTRTDYRKLAETPAFTTDSGNFMLFTPVRYSPDESLDPASLTPDTKVTLTFIPLPHVGNVDIRQDFTVARSTACGFFFATNDAAVTGLCLTNTWPLPPEILKSIELRFRNAPAPPASAALAAGRLPVRGAVVSLSPFSARSRPPETVRLTFRDELAAERRQTVLFRPDGTVLRDKSSLWAALPEADRRRLAELVRQCATVQPPPHTLARGGRDYQVTVEKSEFRWPCPPVRGHWLGIDSAGRDVLARVLYGMRTSLSFGLLLAVAAMVMGALIGAVQGYYAGKVDITAQRLIEIWGALPFLYVMILIGSVYGRSFWLLLFCYGIFNWIGVSHYMRAEFLRLRHMAFVESAICMGVPSRKVILRHIMPNAMTPLITLFPFSLVGAIYSLTALDYLGFGLPPPAASWGDLLQQAQQFRWAWWLILYPSLALFVVMLLGVFIGEGIRDAYDPKRFSKME